MLTARRQFLEAQHYQPLSNMINLLAAPHIMQHQHTGHANNVLDAGCGEGYYIARLQRHLHSTLDTPCSFYGLDTSKDAVRMAAKRHKHICFFVADIKQRIHIPDQSLHMLLNIFAPRNTREFARVLAPHGILLTIVPAPNHLREVRETLDLLTIEPHKQQRVVEQFQHDFALMHTATLEYPLQLGTQAIDQIVTMTPNCWHQNSRSRLEQINQIDTHAAFLILVFHRRS
jgi:23S rRNA (guanine745-N1)-methyltransferase